MKKWLNGRSFDLDVAARYQARAGWSLVGTLCLMGFLLAAARWRMLPRWGEGDIGSGEIDKTFGLLLSAYIAPGATIVAGAFLVRPWADRKEDAVYRLQGWAIVGLTAVFCVFVTLFLAYGLIFLDYEEPIPGYSIKSPLPGLSEQMDFLFQCVGWIYTLALGLAVTSASKQ